MRPPRPAWRPTIREFWRAACDDAEIEHGRGGLCKATARRLEDLHLAVLAERFPLLVARALTGR